jgi:HEAT repeat protein
VHIPHELVRTQVDWSWTPALLQRLVIADDVERSEIADTLSYLGDPRSAVPLRALVIDPRLPDGVRLAASGLLRNYLVDDPGDATLRAWWHAGDALLSTHAILSMGPVQADIIVPVASDPCHPRHRNAIRSMGNGFEAPAHQRIRIAALGHADPAVRCRAADSLFWDEPCIAEDALIIALDDPSPDVASSAAETLCWYRSRRVLRALAARPGLLADASWGINEIASFFVDAVRGLPEPARPALRRWLAPVDDLLTAAWAEPESEPVPARATPAAAAVDVDRLLAALAVVDGPRAGIRDQVRAVSPEQIASADRARLARAAIEQIDPDLRRAAATWCGHWGLAEPLSVLLGDPHPLVRKWAVWAFSDLPPDPALAPMLRAHLDAAGTTGIHDVEVLCCYVVHAGRDRAIATLSGIAHAEDHDQSMVLTAVHELIALEARDALAALMPRLAAPPLVTWEVHVALLEAANRFALPAPQAAQLADVDQLDVQVQLALLGAAR